MSSKTRVDMWDSQLVSSVCESTPSVSQQGTTWIEGAQALEIGPENSEEELASFASFSTTEDDHDVFEPLLPYLKDIQESHDLLLPSLLSQIDPQQPQSQQQHQELPQLHPLQPLNLGFRQRSSSLGAKRSYCEALDFYSHSSKRRNSTGVWSSHWPHNCNTLQPSQSVNQQQHSAQFTPITFVDARASPIAVSANSPSSDTELSSEHSPRSPHSSDCSPALSPSPTFDQTGERSSWVWKNQTQRICNKYICVPLPPHVKAMTNMMGHFRLGMNSPNPTQEEEGEASWEPSLVTSA